MTSAAFLRLTARWVGLAGAVVLLVLVLLKGLSFGCGNVICHPWGYRFGVALMFGAFLLVLPGSLCLQPLENGGHSTGEPRFFSALATGLVLLITYVYLRSALNQWIWPIPVTRWELVAVVALMGLIRVFSWRKRGYPVTALPFDRRQMWISFAILLAVSVAIADRELPRTVMLSSDPDFHVFFGLQVERMGGVPYQQTGWGGQPFNYPAGSGVLQFVWRSLGGLDPRNLLTALPLLFSVLSGLVIAECFLSELKVHIHRAMLLLFSMSMVVAAFLFPLFAAYAHMENVARQMSLLFSALFMSQVATWARVAEPAAFRTLLVPSLTFFVLMVLNPANVAIPSCILVALGVYFFLSGKAAWQPLLVLVAGLVLGLLDPFYQNMVVYTQGARTDTVIYSDALSIKSSQKILTDAVYFLRHGFEGFLRELTVLVDESKIRIFLIFFALYGFAALLLSRKVKWRWAAVFAVLTFIALLFLGYALTHALDDDTRAFLLANYIFFNFSQYKALLLIFLASLVLVSMMKKRSRPGWVVLAAAVMVLPLGFMMREAQGIVLDPRREDCGALGCIEEQDLALLRQFERLVSAGAFTQPTGEIPRVLLPNAVAKMQRETWIFPVSSARVLPYFKVLPAAFYYFQGDAEYGTASYLAHVCERLDRTWLRSKGIRYLYLPSEREQACVAGMETLIGTEEVVLNEGGAYLLRLREPSVAQTEAVGQ